VLGFEIKTIDHDKGSSSGERRLKCSATQKQTLYGMEEKALET
jgi:hypothetical protein